MKGIALLGCIQLLIAVVPVLSERLYNAKTPTITYISPTQTKAVGEKVTFECGVENLQNNLLVWFRKENQQIVSSGKILYSSDSRYSLRHNATVFVLELRDLRLMDAATYECQLPLLRPNPAKAQVQLKVTKTPVPTVPTARAAAPNLPLNIVPTTQPVTMAPLPTPAPRSFTARCTTAKDCAGDLVCKNGKCGCTLAEEVYDTARKTCVSKVGGPCSTMDECVPQGNCEKPKDGPGHCICNGTYVPNDAGFCEVPLGGNCKKATDCDSVAGLACIDNFCRCESFAEFDPTTRQCKGKSGAPCVVSAEDECVAHAKCIESLPQLPGRCTCESGYEENTDYTCKKKSLFG